MRPPTLLLFLLVLATIGGAVAYTNYQRILLAASRPEPASEPRPAEKSTAPPPESPDASKKISFLEEQIKLLKKENENLAKSVEKLREAAAPPTTEGPSARSSTDALVRAVEEIRQLKFKRPLKFVPVPVAEIEKRIHAGFEAEFPAAQVQARERAARAIGLVHEPFKFLDALTGLAFEQAGGYYDAATAEMFVDEAADFEARADLKGKLVKEIAWALLQQHFESPPLSGFASTNDDAALARRAVFIGDAVVTKIHYGVVDALNNDYSRAQQPSAQTQFTGAPLFMRELFLFPYMMSSNFSQELQQEGASPDAAFARPPRSTAEVLHVELYRQKPPFEPVSIAWRDITVRETPPFFDNVLGEFGIYILLKRHLTEDQAFNASVGWRGDRYVCYPGDEKNGDHVFWVTAWQSEADAADFARAMQTTLLHRYSIPWHKRYEVEGGDFVVNDPYRVIRIRRTPDKKGVTVVDATNGDFSDALEEKLRP